MSLSARGLQRDCRNFAATTTPVIGPEKKTHLETCVRLFKTFF